MSLLSEHTKSRPAQKSRSWAGSAWAQSAKGTLACTGTQLEPAASQSQVQRAQWWQRRRRMALKRLRGKCPVFVLHFVATAAALNEGKNNLTLPLSKH